MWISVQGMYEYDNSLFDGLDIPTYTDQDGVVHVIDKSTVINNICLKCAELEILYPSFDTMKLAIGVWSAANQETWYKLIETQFIKYNPIWNVDAHELETYGRGYTNEMSYNSQDKRTTALTDKDTRSLTDTRSVKGFNSSTWAEAEKTDYSGTDTLDHYGSDTMDYSGKDTNTGREDSGKEVTRQGNIGVTASQDLIKKSREIAEFNIIDYIADSFKKRFCLMVY